MINIIGLFIPFRKDKKAKKCFRDIKKMQRLLSEFQWKDDIKNTDLLNTNIEILMSEISYSKRKSNEEQIASIFRSYYSEINEIYTLSVTLVEIKEPDKVIQQIVVNRTNYVIQQIIKKLCVKNENKEVVSEEYTNAS